MYNFYDIFNKKHVFLPVIHAENIDQVLKNVEIAHSNKCDGVFLINHSVTSSKLLEIHHRSKSRFPGFWMGVNLLGEKPVEIFEMLNEEIDGLWTDNAFIDEKTDNQFMAEEILTAQKSSGWHGLYFGGVAFKYQRHVDDAGKAAQIAANYMDVVTTSGKGTGISADIEKIKIMKKAVGDFPLAIASGITLYNIEEYLDFADCFLVASYITSNKEYLLPKIVKAMSDKIGNYKRN